MNLRNLSIYAMCLLVLLGLGSQGMMAQSMNVEDWMTITEAFLRRARTTTAK